MAPVRPAATFPRIPPLRHSGSDPQRAVRLSGLAGGPADVSSIIVLFVRIIMLPLLISPALDHNRRQGRS